MIQRNTRLLFIFIANTLIQSLKIIKMSSPLNTITITSLIKIPSMKIRLAQHESEKESELSNLRLQTLRGNIRLADLEQNQVFTKGLKTLVKLILKKIIVRFPNSLDPTRNKGWGTWPGLPALYLFCFTKSQVLRKVSLSQDVAFSNVSSTCLPDRIQCDIGCICLAFLHCAF